MTILGAILAFALSYILYIFIGPYGILVVLAVLFGLVFSTHHKTKEIYSDMKKIKEHLGLLSNEEKEESQIEEELKEAVLNIKDKEKLESINREIELELEKLQNDDGKKRD